MPTESTETEEVSGFIALVHSSMLSQDLDGSGTQLKYSKYGGRDGLPSIMLAALEFVKRQRDKSDSPGLQAFLEKQKQGRQRSKKCF